MARDALLVSGAMLLGFVILTAGVVTKKGDFDACYDRLSGFISAQKGATPEKTTLYVAQVCAGQSRQ